MTGHRLRAGGLMVVLAVLATAAAWLGLRLTSAEARTDRDAAILHAARQQVVNFTTLDYRRFDTDLRRVLDGATGDFEQEYTSRAEELKRLVAANQAVSQGRVLEAGIASADADSAQVLVVADSTVTNTAAVKPQLRHYRIRLELLRKEDRWLTSRLEFVG